MFQKEMNKGITLIALIVTIVVIVVISGVVINMALRKRADY